MDGWPAAFVRNFLIAAVFAAITLSVLPRHTAHAPDGDSDRPEHPHKHETALRIPDRPALSELTRCRPSDSLAPEVVEALKRASSGDAVAQYALGVAYLHGQGVPCDRGHASDLIGDSADTDYAPAQYMLGVMAETGPDSSDSVEDAIVWYRRAAADGHVLAMRRLASLLIVHGTSKRDQEDALEWFCAAAKYGDVDSQVNLGLMYGSGNDYGLEPSPVTAYYWFDVAAQLGDAGAFDLKRAAARELELDELRDANRRANVWRPAPEDKAANADFDSIIANFAPPPETLEITEPSTAADAPAS